MDLGDRVKGLDKCCMRLSEDKSLMCIKPLDHAEPCFELDRKEYSIYVVERTEDGFVDLVKLLEPATKQIQECYCKRQGLSVRDERLRWSLEKYLRLNYGIPTVVSRYIISDCVAYGYVGQGLSPPSCLGSDGPCSVKVGLMWVESMTAYSWEGQGEDPNHPVLLCATCTRSYCEYWEEMWDEYNQSRI